MPSRRLQGSRRCSIAPIAKVRLVGQYVPAAEFEPAPPAELPPTIEVDNTTYVFNEVEVNIDIQNLTFVEVTTIQNIEVSIYVDAGVQGQPTRCYAVSSDGQVVGQYVSVDGQSGDAPSQHHSCNRRRWYPPWPRMFLPRPPSPPQAITTCVGNPGPINAQGLPTYLPNRIQIGGVSYVLGRPRVTG